jgi:hypothetical protein
MHLLLNQTRHPSQHIFPPQLSLYFVSNMYICYLRHPGVNVRWRYSHSKYTFSSSLAVLGISLFPIKGDENGGSDVIIVRACVNCIMVGSFRRIGRGLNNLLPPRVPKFPLSAPRTQVNDIANYKTNFSVQNILHKRTFLGGFVKMTEILYFHPTAR